jgi:hypothetical protein
MSTPPPSIPRPGILERYCKSCGGFLHAERVDDTDAVRHLKASRVLADTPGIVHAARHAGEHKCKGHRGGVGSPHAGGV